MAKFNPKFKVDDKVKVVANNVLHRYKIGGTYYVNEITAWGSYKLRDEEGNTIRVGFIGEGDLELSN